jgi:hypothetical protein
MLVRISPPRVDQARENDWIMLVGNDTGPAVGVMHHAGLSRRCSTAASSVPRSSTVTWPIRRLKPANAGNVPAPALEFDLVTEFPLRCF